ncbi:MAG: AsmA-like C-terminal region-containing protein [Muribaculaceae bacterium]|nr:AsmA-like C-terminal region-containing protein [Muribaculaceae bacterium]
MTSQSGPTITASRARLPLWRRILRACAWTAFTVFLFTCAVLLATVRMLHPDRLTPLVQRAANDYLINSNFTVGRVQLGLQGSFPFLSLTMDDICLTSTAFSKLSEDERFMLPEYADTLLTMKSLQGSLNLPKLMAGTIELGDVNLYKPGINVVVYSDDVNNFDIFPSDPDAKPFTIDDLAEYGIRIHRFELTDPLPMRYFNAVDGTEIALDFNNLMLDGNGAPLYTFDMRGNISTPLMEGSPLEKIPFSVNGNIQWDIQHPRHLGLSDFKINIMGLLSGTINTTMTLAENLTLNTVNLSMDPISFSQVLAMVPEEVFEAFEIPRIETDGKLKLDVAFDRPYVIDVDTIPYATARAVIEPCSLSLEDTRLTDVSADVEITLRGNNLDAASVNIRGATMSGDATDLNLNGTLTHPVSDPHFKGHIEGTSDLEKLPPPIKKMLDGYVSGKLEGNVDVDGSPSMLTPDRIHKLKVTGEIEARGLYWLSADTVNMAYIHKARFHFGTADKFIHKESGIKADSLLTASITIDSINFLHGDVAVNATDLFMGVGTSNKRRGADTSRIIPLGATLKLERLTVIDIADSAGMVSKAISGYLVLQRNPSNRRLPLIKLNMDISQLSAGTRDTRLLLRDPHIDATMERLPLTERQKAISHTADSLKRIYPDIPRDSVYILALERHRRSHKRYPRVHPELVSGDNEIIDWGASRGFRRLLKEWEISGTLKASRAGMFSPYFPLRNRIKNFNVAFTNDSLVLKDIQYKAGHSDFLLSGRVTNMKRAFTSRSGRQPLRVHFDLLSDTVDVNQLAAATFAGNAYSQRKDKETFSITEGASEDELDEKIGRYVENAPDNSAPLLIPLNVDVEIKARASNILYSDIALHDFSGDLLIFDGALNLHNLRGSTELGDLTLSALYAAPDPTDLRFGFGMQVNDFNIERFLHLVPAIDSVMPLMRGFEGIIDADIAATVDLKPNMDFNMPTLHAVVRLEGNKLVFIDPETYRIIGKWLMFKDKNRNVIDHMSVQLMVQDDVLHVFPFIFDIDRYRLGVQGYNDLNMNFDYHIAVLKSPIPFKFGINIKGNPEHHKIRLGRSRFNEKNALAHTRIADTTRINLIDQIEKVFSRGVRNSRFNHLTLNTRPTAAAIDLETDSLTHADSLALIKEGLIPEPLPAATDTPREPEKKKKSSHKPAETSAVIFKETPLLREKPCT